MKQINILLIVFVHILIIGCTNQKVPSPSKIVKEEQMHEEHKTLQDNLGHKDIIILDNPIISPNGFNRTFESFFKSYLSLQKALVKSDIIEADKAANKMDILLKIIPKDELEQKDRAVWINHKTGYAKNLSEFLHIKSLDDKRSYFSHITEILYCTLKSFDMKTDHVYVAFCPMAFDNKGAYWLADSSIIRNPYFGDKMLKCGKIEEIL